jgi:RNA polymerase sigma-70 factor (ECF subfamily)
MNVNDKFPKAPGLPAELSSLPDDLLMARLRAGCDEALAVIFDRYHRLVLNIALQVLRDKGEAEDLVQSVFLEICQCCSHYDKNKGTLKTWILQYAYHRSFNRRDYLKLRGIYGEPQLPVQARHVLLGHVGSWDAVELSRMLQEAFGKLTGPQKKTLRLAFYAGLTMHEIALATGDSFDSVRHNYYRGLDKLRSILRERPAVPEKLLASGKPPQASWAAVASQDRKNLS